MEAAIHPAGGRIAFQTEKEGNSEIYMMGCDGSEPVNLTNHVAEDRHPSWSTDGRIAFISDRDAEEGVYNQYDIYLLDLEMENISRLTEIEGNVHSPALSPDGRKVAFVSDEEGNSEILLLDVTSGSISNFTKDPASDLDPAWASDSERLLFASDRDGDFDIYIAEIDGFKFNQRYRQWTKTMKKHSMIVGPIWGSTSSRTRSFSLPIGTEIGSLHLGARRK